MLCFSCFILLAGCFKPSFAPGECSEGGNCPSNLECSPRGFCCEAGEECGPEPEIDASPDPDAGPISFTEHLSPYTCDSETLFLLHFDELPFIQDPSCANRSIDSEVDEFPVPSASGFGMAVDLDPNPTGDMMKTRFVGAEPFGDPKVSDGYSVEAWFQGASPPPSGKQAIIFSAVKLAPNGDLEGGMYSVRVTEDSLIRVELFGANCANILPDGVFDAVTKASTTERTHARLTVTETHAYLFINGVHEITHALSGAPCFDPETAEHRVGGLERGTMHEFDLRIGFSGEVDEFRVSTSPRAPIPTE